MGEVDQESPLNIRYRENLRIVNGNLIQAHMNTMELLLLQMHQPRHMDDGWSWGWGGGILGILFWVILFGLVIAMIWFLFKRGGGRGTSGRTTSQESPREVLDRRYAEGKIDEEEYRRKKEELQS